MGQKLLDYFLKIATLNIVFWFLLIPPFVFLCLVLWFITVGVRSFYFGICSLFLSFYSDFLYLKNCVKDAKFGYSRYKNIKERLKGE